MSTLWFRFYYYPHFTDMKTRLREVKRDLQAHPLNRAQVACTTGLSNPMMPVLLEVKVENLLCARHYFKHITYFFNYYNSYYYSYFINKETEAQRN